MRGTVWRDAWDALASLARLTVAPIRDLLQMRGAFSAREVRLAADAAGLRLRPRRRDGRSTYVGEIEGYRVTLRPVDPTSHAGLAVEFRGRGSVPYRLRIEKRLGAGGSSVLTGDPEFDAVFRVRGPRARTLAILGEARRRRIIARGLFEEGVSLQRGRLRYSGPFIREPGALEKRLRQLREMADALRAPFRSVPALLARHAENEETAPVRKNCLRALLETHPEHPETARACRARLSDPDATVRYVAALGAGPEGVPVLAAVAADERENSDTRVEAMRAIASAAADDAIAAVAIPLLGSADDAVRAAAAEALGRGNGATAEPPLLRALAAPIAPSTLAIVRALARVGTVGSVPPLLSIPAPPVVPREVKDAATEAIASIQSRIPGGTHGALAMAADASDGAGTLSVSAEAGRLALPDRAADERPANAE